MISNSQVTPTLPVVDIERAKKFYRDVLGLRITMEDPMGVTFEAGGCSLFLYQRGPTKADHTVASFRVEDIRKEVNDLRLRGVKFEEYDIPEMQLKTVDGVATYRSDQYESKSAWFKDTEGNILALVELHPVNQYEPQREPVGAAASSSTDYDWYDY